MATGIRKDPYLGFRFRVEIENLLVGGFTEVSGLQSDTEFEDYREGGVNTFVHKMLKATKYPNLVLKRGLTDSDILWNWHKEVAEGRIVRRSGSVILVDAAGEEQWRWNFTKAYPVKWSGPELKGDSNSVAIEVIELVHQGISMIKP